MRNVVCLSVVVWLGTAAACGSSLTHGGPDGGTPDLQTGDAATCQCHLEGDGGAQALTISWDCFCATQTCAPANSCGDVGGFNVQRTAYPSCGLTTYSVDPAGGTEIWVYDSSGAEVGAQLTSDDSVFYCPSDHSLSAYLLRA